MSTANPRQHDARERLVDAAVEILATDGPGEIKARRLATATGMSTMMVYSTFGGIPGLVATVRERGFTVLETAFEQIPRSADIVADLFAHALTCWRFATNNPHLYDLMFGLSVRSTYRPIAEPVNLSGQLPAFAAANAHVTALAERLVAERPTITETAASVTAQLWSYVHGFVSLELAGHFAEFDDPVAEVFLPMGVKLVIAMGDPPERARRSHHAGRAVFESIPNP